MTWRWTCFKAKGSVPVGFSELLAGRSCLVPGWSWHTASCACCGATALMQRHDGSLEVPPPEHPALHSRGFLTAQVDGTELWQVRKLV